MQMQRHSARSWAQPDTRRASAEAVGQWDCYCVACGRYVLTYAQASTPGPVACSRCERLASFTRGTLVAQDAAGAHKPSP